MSINHVSEHTMRKGLFKSKKKRKSKFSTRTMRSSLDQALVPMVQEGLLKLVYEFSMPRACGTLFERCLSQNAPDSKEPVDGQIHEPFIGTPSNACKRKQPPYTFDEVKLNSFPHDDSKQMHKGALEEGMKQIFLKFQKIQTQRKVSKESPVKLVIKDHVSCFTKAMFNRVLPLCVDIVFTVREPMANMNSSLKNLINLQLGSEQGLSKDVMDLLIFPQPLEEKAVNFQGDFESIGVSPEKLAKLCGKSPEALRDSDLIGEEVRNKLFAGVIDGYIRNWRNVFFFMQYLQKKNHSFVIFDGGLLQEDPAKHLQQVCERLENISYHEGMHANMQEFRGENFHSVATNHWGPLITNVCLGRAIQSQEIIPSPAVDFSLESFPQSLHDAILEAQEIYEKVQQFSEYVANQELNEPVSRQVM